MVSTTGKLTYYDGVPLWVRLHEYEALQRECDEMREWIRGAAIEMTMYQTGNVGAFMAQAEKWLKEVDDAVRSDDPGCSGDGSWVDGGEIQAGEETGEQR